jgi:hypothetical protein
MQAGMLKQPELLEPYTDPVVLIAENYRVLPDFLKRKALGKRLTFPQCLVIDFDHPAGRIV